MEKQSAQLKVPSGFLLGAGNSAHQVEGQNTNSDWWYFEQLGRLPKSETATDHYHNYDQDFSLAESIGLTAFRISIEWARIEPQEGQFDRSEIEHYRKVLQSMKQHNLKRIVTLWHFTLPLWFAQKGGFAHKENIKLFVRYAQFVVEQLHGETDLWLTLNEPEVYSGNSYRVGVWPPFKKNIYLAWRVYRNLAWAHKQAYKYIKQAVPQAIVGLAKNNVYYEPRRANSLLDRFVVRLTTWFGNHWWLNKLNGQFDFIGLNYYFYHSLQFSLTSGIIHVDRSTPKSDMGWRTFPEGIYHLLKDLGSLYHKPIYVTENGIANARDDMRQDFIREHIYWTLKAKAEGVDVRGYFYWSLTDTYEWQDGFDPKFGLVEVDFKSLERKVRQSSNIFKQLL